MRVKKSEQNWDKSKFKNPLKRGQSNGTYKNIVGRGISNVNTAAPPCQSIDK